MDTIEKALQPRSTERLIEALSTLGALLDRTIDEVKTLDADFQNRLLQAVHDTESSMQQQASDHVQRAIEEANQRVRIQVLEEMKAQVEHDIAAAVENVRQEVTVERDRLNKELDRATQAAAEWEAERARLNAEYSRVRQELAGVRDEQANTPVVAPPVTPVVTGNAANVQAEIARVEGLIRDIMILIDDPATDLSTVMRKNVQRAELDAYLKGIRFAIGQA